MLFILILLFLETVKSNICNNFYSKILNVTSHNDFISHIGVVNYSIEPINQRNLKNQSFTGSFYIQDEIHSICLDIELQYNITFTSSEKETILQVSEKYELNTNEYIIIEWSIDNNNFQSQNYDDKKELFQGKMNNSSVKSATLISIGYDCSDLFGSYAAAIYTGTFLCNAGSFIQSFYAFDGDGIDSLGFFCSDGNSYGPTTYSGGGGFDNSSICSTGYNEVSLVAGNYIGQITLYNDLCSTSTFGKAQGVYAGTDYTFACKSNYLIVGFLWYSKDFLNAIEFICGEIGTNNPTPIPTISSSLLPTFEGDTNYPSVLPTEQTTLPTSSPMNIYSYSPVFGNTANSTDNGTYICKNGAYIQYFYGNSDMGIDSLGFYCNDGESYGPTPSDGGGTYVKTTVCYYGLNYVSGIAGQYIGQITPFSIACRKVSIGQGKGIWSGDSFTFGCISGEYLIGMTWYSNVYVYAVEFICSAIESLTPTIHPSPNPTNPPTLIPSSLPSLLPTLIPSIHLVSDYPTSYPTLAPLSNSVISNIPTHSPSIGYEYSPLYGNPEGSILNGTYLCKNGSTIKYFFGNDSSGIHSVGIHCSDDSEYGPTPSDGLGNPYHLTNCPCGYNNITTIAGQYIGQFIVYSDYCAKTCAGLGIGVFRGNAYSYSCSEGRTIVGINWYSGSFVYAIQFICGFGQIYRGYDNERETLNNLYNSLSGPYWSNSQYWFSNESLSCWYGISLDSSGHVNEISLVLNKLKGYISDDIGNLKYLNSLILDSNVFLTGTIPTSFQQLTNLTYLSLQGCNIEGTTNFSTLVNLEQIHICCNLFSGNLDYSRNVKINFISSYHNSFTGNIPLLGQNIFLTNIYLSQNFLTGKIHEIPKNITLYTINDNFISGELPSDLDSLNLKTFSVFNNFLQGSIPSLPLTIEALYCHYNSFTGTLPSFSELNDLVDLNFGINFLIGQVPTAPNNIVSFCLIQNRLTGPFPIVPATILYFDLANNSFTGTLPTFPKEIIEISCYFNYVTGTFPNVSLFTNLQNIGAYGNLMTGKFNLMPISLLSCGIEMNYFTGILISLPLLIQSFQANENYFTGKSPEISNSVDSIIFRLVMYDIEDNFITGRIPDLFINLNFMKYFQVALNSLTGTFPSLDQHWYVLWTLWISYNYFTGELSILFSESVVFAVVFSDNYFEGLPPSIQSDYYLQDYYAQNNYFTGNAPALGGSMIYLYLYNNYFYGNISTVEMYPHLVVFEGQYNYFSGTISEIIGSLYKLNIFYLNSNDVTGTLPLKFCSLSNFRLLDITDLNMCVPSCLTRAAYSVNKFNFIRCQNEQDLALCSMLKNSDLYDKLSVSLDYETTVYETPHPYNHSDDSLLTNYVYTPGASGYELTFDEWTDIEYSSSEYALTDYFVICEDSNCERILYKFNQYEIPGLYDNPSLEILLESFYISLYAEHFNYDSISTVKFDHWGYLVTVKAKIPLTGWNCSNISPITQTYDNHTLSLYNLTSNNSYANNLCHDDYGWKGITCVFVTVTTLELESYGISGLLPSSLGLLTGLEILDLKYNSFYGAIPDTFGNLSSLQLLDLSNNNLKNSIPSKLGKLTQLQYLYLESNSFTSTMPDDFAYLNESLLLMSLSANQLTGKLLNNLCSLSNASIDISGNNMDCYEDCWDHVNGITLKSGGLPICAPTSYPTSLPTAPTIYPTQSNVNAISKFNEWSYVLGTCLVVLGLVAFCWFYYKVNSKETRIKRARNEALVKLPIHRYIINRESTESIVQIILYSPWTISTRDYDGNNVIELIFKYQLNNEIVKVVLKQLLSLLTDETILSKEFSYAWLKIIQLDIYIDSVNYIINTYHTLNKQFTNCVDENGRLAVNIASPLCRQAMKESLYFLRRYDFGDNIYPTHVSESSIVYIVIDTHFNNTKVALKFLSNRNSYINEVRSRSVLSNAPESIIQILNTYEAENNSLYDIEIRRKKMDNYKYCIVMPAGEKNLGNIINTERLAQDWIQLQSIAIRVAQAVSEFHSKGYIHGDLKPLNIIRIGNDIKLIDFDACAKIDIENYGSKLSQAYIPPESLYKDDKGNVQVKGGKLSSMRSTANVKLLRAHYSQDSWSFGILLYELFTGVSFFLKDYDDDIDDESLYELYEFTEEFKTKKLARISSKLARNLVSLLLDKDPTKRLSMSRVLEHPFITNKSSPRLIGEKAEYDVFISYRVDADANHAEMVYDLLTSEGTNVWWDKKCLLSGKDWEDGFSEGLVKSQIFVPIISKNSLNNSSNPRCNITLLEENSKCDNVMLEYELALELRERGLISHIYPILIGDYDNTKDEYDDYFKCGGYPSNVKNVLVNLIESNVRNHLNRLGLGSRLIENEGVKSVLDQIMKSQGTIVKGSKSTAFIPIVKDISSMRTTFIAK